MRHVVTHPYRRTPITREIVFWTFWFVATMVVLTVIYQGHLSDQRGCVKDLTVSWSADPRNVDQTLPDYRWFEEQCR